MEAVAAGGRMMEKIDRLLAQLKPCPCCASKDIYWSECAGRFLVHPTGGGGPVYGRWVCRECGLGTTPCPASRAENAAAQWNVRMDSQSHSSDYWRLVRAEESILLEERHGDHSQVS